MPYLSFEDYDSTPTPEQLCEIYDSGFKGAYYNRNDYVSFRPYIPSFYSDFPKLHGSGKGKVSKPFIAALTFDPEFGRYEAQGTGDCHEVGLDVTTPQGFKEIQNFKVGDFVFTPQGNVRRVIDTIKKPYSGKMIRLKVAKYYNDIAATPDHKLWVYPNVDKKYLDDCDDELVSKAIEDIEIGDYVCIPRIINENHTKNVKFDLLNYSSTECITEDTDFKRLRLTPVEKGKIRAKNSKKSVNRYIDFNEKLGWLLGLYAAEGGIDGFEEKRNIKDFRITYNLGSHEGIIAEQVKQYFKELFGIEARIYQVPSKPTVIYVRISNILVTNLFKSLCPGNTYSKKFNHIVNKVPSNIRLSILKGWFDGDGHYSDGGRSSATTVSQELSKQMFNLANSCNLYPTITQKDGYIDKNEVNHQDSYTVHLNKNSTSVIKNIHTENILSISYNKFITKHGMAVKVVEKEEYYIDDYVYCLNVDIDHMFIGNGFAEFNCVSHSSRNAGMIDYCVDAMFGETTYEGRFCTENIYGYRGHGGQGASCARLAKYVSQSGPGGFLVRKRYEDGNNSIDLSKYDWRKGHNWGRRGTPSWINKIASANKGLKVWNIKSVEEARDAIASGFGLSVCSGYGFSRKRNKDGVAERSGGWNHAMSWIAVDDSDWAHSNYDGPLFLIQNSWGRFNSGGKRHDQPDGSFFIRPKIAERMIRGGGCFAIASIRGYNRELVYDSQSSIKF